jgi:hypothetical protein
MEERLHNREEFGCFFGLTNPLEVFTEEFLLPLG